MPGFLFPLSPGFIFKENSLSAERAQPRRLRPPSGLSKAPLLLGTPSPRGRHGLGAHSESARALARGLHRREQASGAEAKAPALIPNSENPLSHQMRSAAPFPPPTRPVASARLLLGSLSGAATPRAGLRRGRRSGRGSPTSKGHRRRESFPFQHPARPCLLGLGLWLGPCSGPGRAGLGGGVCSVSTAGSHASLPTPSPVSAPSYPEPCTHPGKGKTAQCLLLSSRVKILVTAGRTPREREPHSRESESRLYQGPPTAFSKTQPCWVTPGRASSSPWRSRGASREGGSQACAAMADCGPRSRRSPGGGALCSEAAATTFSRRLPPFFLVSPSLGGSH